ncbi:MAG: hypothetical protein KDD60_08875, partial [Bdellovibrionales bacterium]|nr:hypothetical protein [Bdellovibrionales bacterium]
LIVMQLRKLIHFAISLGFSVQLFSVPLLTGLTVTGLSGCGGGGGGGATYGNPGYVVLDASPRKIDAGDRITVTLHITDIKRNDFPGLIVKVLVPSSMHYVTGSAVLSTRDDLVENYDPDVEDADEASYILFYIDSVDVPANDRSAVIQFVLRGTGSTPKGTIAVDLDVVNQDNRDKFDKTNPLFTALDSLEIEVID